jgi:hypothetical protein
MPSRAWLLPILGFLLLYTSRANFFALLVLDLTCATLIDADWWIAGTWVHPSDFILAAFAFLFVSGRWPEGGMRLRDVPLLRLWVLLGFFLSFSYLTLPYNAERLTDPLRILYQLYRYCWKPIIYYPLAVLIIGRDVDRARKLMFVVLALGCVTAVTTLVTYVAGGGVGELIEGKNRFAGSLIAPTTACIALLLAAPAGRNRLLLTGALGVLGIGLVAAGSRGAIVAAGVAGIVLVTSLARFSGGRKRLARLFGWAAAAALIALLMVPDLGRFAGTQELAELSEGTKVDNLTWRMQLRWPYFWRKAVAHPWIGIGTDRDETLADEANTPHNGYLSLALIHGLPVAALFIFFGLRSAIHAWRNFLHRGEARPRLLALGASAAIIGIMTHNIVESTLTHRYVGKLFWVLLGIAAVSSLLGRTSPAVVERAERSTQSRGRPYGGRIPVRPIVPSPGQTP